MVAIAHPQQLPTRTLRLVSRGSPHRSVRSTDVRSTYVRSTYVRRRLGAGLLAVLVAVGSGLALRAGTELLTADLSTAPSTVRTGTAATDSPATVLVPDPAAFGSSGVALPAGATYVVQRGDTLWAIARTLAPGDDVTATVARLRELNGSSGVQVGQRLRLR